MTNLLRNAGFERGKLDFWDKWYADSIVITDAKAHRGTYSAKVEANNDGLAGIKSLDYIPIRGFSSVHQIIYVYPTENTSLYMYLTVTDDNKDTIKDYEMSESVSSGGWRKLECTWEVGAEAVYGVVYAFICGATHGNFYYYDDMFLSYVDLDGIGVDIKELIKVVNDSGAHTANGIKFYTGMWHEAEYFLTVTSLVGTNQTLDVKIQSYDDISGTWYDIVTFTQATGTAAERRILAANIGDINRVQYTTGGTVDDCDFKVGVVYKR